MSDITHKFVAVLNKKIEPGKLMNALAHASVVLGELCPDKVNMRISNYADKDGNDHFCSDNPYIILAADNSNKIRTLRTELIRNGVCFTDFTHSMTIGSYQEQKDRTKTIPEAELEYYVIAMFGEMELLSTLTKKFSLWK